MSGETDLIKLYSARILALAADIPNLKRITDPDASVKKRAPLCGSTVTVDVNVAGGKITDIGQDVKACALGQAAASIVGAVAIGCTLEQIIVARDALTGMLKTGGPTPEAPFEGFEVLRPAQAYKNRHASILLSLTALVEAVEIAKQDECA